MDPLSSTLPFTFPWGHTSERCPLEYCYYSIHRYRLLSLMRASSVVNLQSILPPLAAHASCQASTCAFSVSESGTLWCRH